MTKNMKRSVLLITLILLAVLPLLGNNYAGEIFTFSPGAMNNAMGNTGLCLPSSHASGWWNPALPALDNNRSAEIMHSNFFDGLLAQNQLSMRFGQGFSLTVNHLKIDKVKLTLLENEDEEISDSNRPYAYKTISNQDLILYGSFGRALSENFAFGISPKLAYRNLAEHSGYGFGADLGAYYKINKHLDLGVNLRDFFGTQILWENSTHEVALPNLDMELSTNFELSSKNIPVHVALRAQNFYEQRENASSDGIRSEFHAGIMLRPIPALGIMGGYDTDSFTAGVALNLYDFGLNYAFKNKAENGLGHTQRVSLSYSW